MKNEIIIENIQKIKIIALRRPKAGEGPKY